MRNRPSYEAFFGHKLWSKTAASQRSPRRPALLLLRPLKSYFFSDVAAGPHCDCDCDCDCPAPSPSLPSLSSSRGVVPDASSQTPQVCPVDREHREDKDNNFCPEITAAVEISVPRCSSSCCSILFCDTCFNSLSCCSVTNNLRSICPADLDLYRCPVQETLLV